MFRLRKIISLLLLTLCLQWVFPRELWHSLCDHTDTIDHCSHSESGLSFSVKHEHCLILELSVPPMNHEEQSICFIPLDFSFISYIFSAPESQLLLPEFFEGRGPPFIS